MAWRTRPPPHLLAARRIRARSLRTQPRFDYVPPHEVDEPTWPRPAALATPRQLVQHLDEYIVGQENAKKVLSVAVFNHYTRVRANLASLQEEQEVAEWTGTNVDADRISAAQIHPHPYRLPSKPAPLFEKSNVLVIGPTGSGKTLLARTLAKVLDVPFSVSDATTFTQAGYVGEDVDMAIQRLLQAANWDPQRASSGIVYIDEIDKLARKSPDSTGARDVGGEGVQQALLRMMEGASVSVQAKSPPVPVPDAGGSHIGPGGEGRSRAGRGPGMMPPRPETYTIDTSNVLFILSGAFVGLDAVVRRRVAKGSIGFTAPLAPSEDDSAGAKAGDFFTPNKRAGRDLLESVEPSDLVKYGFIPEFISRLPALTTLAPLSVPDLRRILTDVRGSLVSQYAALFGYSGVEIRFTSAALDAICERAMRRGGGARGLRGIMEGLLLEPMYEVPGSSIRHVLINGATARGEEPPQYWSRGQGAEFWAAWAEEEAVYDREQAARQTER